MEKFRYLGVTVTNTNDIREEIKRRINMGSKYYSLEKMLSSHLLSKKLKVKTYETSGKMLLSKHKKPNMFKAKSLIERMGIRYLKQVPRSPQQTIPDHHLYLSIEL